MHVMIVGMTSSGKTTLAKKMARAYQNKKVKVIVLDPMGDKWPADYQTADAADFLRVVKANKNCALFIDESGQTIGRYNPEMEWLATQARHWGHRSHFITQRAAQVSATVRGQCSRLFIFRVSRKDGETLAEEWSEPALLKAGELEQYHYLSVGRFAKPEEHIITPFNG